MYTAFYGLNEKPFALVPDPKYLFLAHSYREALAHLLYGIDEGEGFIEVIGQVGTGKTTLCRTLLERVGPDVEVAFIFNPTGSEIELLAAISREFDGIVCRFAYRNVIPGKFEDLGLEFAHTRVIVVGQNSRRGACR